MKKIYFAVMASFMLVACGVSSNAKNSDNTEKSKEQKAPAKKIPAAQEELEEM